MYRSRPILWMGIMGMVFSLFFPAIMGIESGVFPWWMIRNGWPFYVLVAQTILLAATCAFAARTDYERWVVRAASFSTVLIVAFTWSIVYDIADVLQDGTYVGSGVYVLIASYLTVYYAHSTEC